ncbi:MAG: phosphodiester glycosidase family protein [Kiritimatiellae bacterium]|nr:phosphodiester glycosidase family protein [Kiritimatiellia bacterium]
MKKTMIRIALAAAALAGGMCRADWREDMWTRPVALREGVSVKALALEEPRLMKAYIARVDLSTPGIGFTATDRAENWGETMPDYTNRTVLIDTKRETTAAFMARRRAQGLDVELAVNTAPWGPWVPPFTHTYGSFRGWNVSGGVELSHGKNPRRGAFIVVRKDGRVDATPRVPVAETNSVAIAMCGFGMIMTNGVPTFAVAHPRPAQLAPRTALGVTADRKTLVVLVVDGRQPGYSLGADIEDLYNILRKEGVTDAVNMDGGGSSSLVVYDRAAGRPLMVNRQPRGTERKNALNFGIFFAPDLQK